MSSWQGYTVLMYYVVSLFNNVWLTLLYPSLFLHIMNDRCIKKQTKTKPAGNQTDCSYSQVLHICNTSLVKVQINTCKVTYKMPIISNYMSYLNINSAFHFQSLWNCFTCSLLPLTCLCLLHWFPFVPHFALFTSHFCSWQTQCV